ncbi:mucin-6-like [Rhinoraja longicauda]
MVGELLMGELCNDGLLLSLTVAYAPTRTTCTTWGSEHFRTFDNFIYGFSSTCNYIFVSDCSETLGAFNIQIRRDKLGLLKIISINIWGILIVIKDAKITVNDNGFIKLPYCLNGIQIKSFGDGTRLATKQKGLDLIVTWNNIDYLMVELGNDYREKTCGLCGDFNGHPRLNEFTQGRKKIPIYEFASKYQLDDPSEMCQLMNQPSLKDGLTEYVSDCSGMLNKVAPLCKLPKKNYITECQRDMYKCGPKGNSRCSCQTLSEYSRQCARLLEPVCNWRNISFCPPILCPGDQLYQECGSPCLSTCSNPQTTCDSYGTYGCFCPAGTVLDDITANNRCVPLSHCPCTLNGQVFASGGSVNSPCKTCKCSMGKWNCINLPCPGRCSIEGGSFVTTFDFRQYRFHGVCTYLLVKSRKMPGDGTIEAVFEKSGVRYSETQLTKIIYATNRRKIVICQKGTVEVDNEVKKLPYQDGLVLGPQLLTLYVNDLDDGIDGFAARFVDDTKMAETGHKDRIATSPTSCTNVTQCPNFTCNACTLENYAASSVPRLGNIVIYWQSSSYIQVESTFGLEMQVQIRPLLQLYIIVDESFGRTTHGLCGNFDRLSLNDFNSSMGIEEGTAGSFVDSWRLIEHCKLAHDKDCDPCSLSQSNGVYALSHCSILMDKSGIFGKCHFMVDPTDYYERCRFETCNYERSQDLMCASLSAYVRACAIKGVLLKGWRNVVEECRVTCHSDHVFDYDCKACNHTCFSLSNPSLECTKAGVPVDGCICPPDTFLDDNNKCVSASSCPCFLPDGAVILPGKSTDILDHICICKDGKLDCSIRSFVPEVWCEPPKVYFDCAHAKKYEYRSAFAPTCQMHATETPFTQLILLMQACGCNSTSGEKLEDGRWLLEKKGFVYSPVDHPGSCVSICFRGKWECTGDAKCPSTCVIHGEGHVTTFDGKQYVFDGSCEYTLVQDACSVNYRLPSFKIVTENIICGKTGVVCTKSIKIYLEEVLIKLADGHYTLIPPNAVKHFKVVSNPLYLKFDFVIKAKLELTVIWNKNMNAHISITRLSKFAVCGLCGNYNGNVDDEYITQNKYLVSNLLVFANSWKEDSMCSDVTEVATPCHKNPYRFARAEKMCALINSKVFESCHKLVYRMPYYDNCVRDACGCELVGDCECLCDAVAVYAKACIDAGVCIDWRTPDFCPVYCDYFNTGKLDSTLAKIAQFGATRWHYQPCQCPANIHIFGKFNMEGCYVCAKDEYFNEDLKHCVSCA